VTFKLAPTRHRTVQTQEPRQHRHARCSGVQQQGVTVKRYPALFLLAISLVSKDNRTIRLFLTNYAQINC